MSFFICTIQNAKTLKEALLLYFLLDNASVILVFTLIAWNYYLGIMTDHFLQSVHLLAAVSYSVAFFMFVGNFRVLIKRYSWSKCEVIITKIFFILGASGFTEIACYFMLSQGYE